MRCAKNYQNASGHAYYIQALCYYLWFIAEEEGEVEKRHVNEALKK